MDQANGQEIAGETSIEDAQADTRTTVSLTPIVSRIARGEDSGHVGRGMLVIQMQPIGNQQPGNSHQWLALSEDRLIPVIRTHRHMNGCSSNLSRKVIGRLYRAGASDSWEHESWCDGCWMSDPCRARRARE